MSDAARSPAPVPRVSVPDHVFAQLRQAILSDRYAPGDRLPTQRTLAAELEVNMASVREALGRLEQLRLIEVRHGDATRVLDWRRSTRAPPRRCRPARATQRRQRSPSWPPRSGSRWRRRPSRPRAGAQPAHRDALATPGAVERAMARRARGGPSAALAGFVEAA